MIAFTLAVLFAAEPVVKCARDDAACWARLYDAESDRTALLESGYAAAKRLAAEDKERAESWKAAFLEVKPKPPSVFESPVFWLVVGFAVGAGATVAITYAVNQPR